MMITPTLRVLELHRDDLGVTNLGVEEVHTTTSSAVVHGSCSVHSNEPPAWMLLPIAGAVVWKVLLGDRTCAETETTRTCRLHRLELTGADLLIELTIVLKD